MVSEDILESQEIQGNIIPGFKMPYQFLIAGRVNDKEKFCGWLGQNISSITTMDEVSDYHQERVAKAKALGIFGKESFGLPAQKNLFWLNIGFSSDFMNQFSPRPTRIDDSFRVGLDNRSSTLGDPTDAKSIGNQANWIFGGTGKKADFLLLAGSDTNASLQSGISELKTKLAAVEVTILYDEEGARLDNDTEHFGFKDGISQPEPRGFLRNGTTYLTERKIKSGNEDTGSPELAAPGELLIWPGQFVYGYQKQADLDFRNPVAPSADELDDWVKNGSMLVFRRLKQDVSAFYQSARTQYQALIANAAFKDWAFDDFLSKFVGRKKDGTPLIFLGQTAVGQNSNQFFYKNDTPVLQMKDGSTVPSIKGDTTNTKCPVFAHVRKVNPRDNATDQGGPTDTQTSRILRRGIPFGPPYNHANPADLINEAERGLLFLSYQTNIQGQFELLVNKWMNSNSAPEFTNEAYDMLVGQNAQAGEGRIRVADMPSADPAITCSVTSMADFVIPTGGGYFFSPSITVLKRMSVSTA